MENLPLIEMSELNEHIITTDNFQDKFRITDIYAGKGGEDFFSNEYSAPVRLNALFMILVLRGSADIRIDYVPYTVKENTFLTIMPTHILQAASASDDFKSRMMVIDKDFLEEINIAKRSPSMMNYMQLRQNPCTELLPHEAEHINQCIRTLRDKIRLRTHSFHKEVLQNSFVAFLLELANIYIGRRENIVVPTLSRKEEIMNQFLQLLFEHVKEHHVVSFYADKLFITPQYLSLILKELSGKSANKWIDEALIVEAKLLLKMQNVTIQQVADMLNFSDQSTFGKFFKKHMGVSPMEFRKS